jgi:hypothetical protein
MTLRINGVTVAQGIVYVNRELQIKGRPGQCVGGDRQLLLARTAHCRGGHGVIWNRQVVRGRGVEFWNRAATRADPQHHRHYLMGPQFAGATLFLGTVTNAPRFWRDCAGHCTAPASARTAALSTHRVRPTQLCLDTGPHLCLAALHPGPNSRIVLAPDDRSRAEDVSYGFGQLRFMRLANMCIGRNARTIHCGRPGTGWNGITTASGATKFWNAAATVADPHHPHWLAAVQAPGYSLEVTANWRLPHTWRVCFGHCTRTGAVSAVARVTRADRIFGCAVRTRMRLLTLSGIPHRQAYAKLACTTKPASFHARLSIRKREHGHWVTVATGPPSSASPYPFHWYWYNRACKAGTYQAQLTAGGQNAHGVPLSTPVIFRSRPLTIRNCVAGGASSPTSAAVLAGVG